LATRPENNLLTTRPDQPPPLAILRIAEQVCAQYRALEDRLEGRLRTSAANREAWRRAEVARRWEAEHLEVLGESENDLSTRQKRERCTFPSLAAFRSVLALGYRGSDRFRWHTDMAGDDGWVCSFSLGSTATLEYLPVVCTSAKFRAEAREALQPVAVPLACGDCLLFHGGYLPHRITECAEQTSPTFARMNGGSVHVRVNLQVRIFGASQDHGLKCDNSAAAPSECASTQPCISGGQ